MMGLAIQHGADQPVDAVQLNTLDQNFDEDDILGEDDQKEKNRKVKGEDDFGMSSDEEQRLEARKKAKKDKTVEQARVEAEQENAKRN